MHSSTYEQVHRPLRQCIYNYAYILQLLMPIGSYTVDLGLNFAQDSCYVFQLQPSIFTQHVSFPLSESLLKNLL